MLFQNFSSSNTLFDVPVDTARRSSRPGRATIISGSMYSGLVQFAGTQDREPGWSADPQDVLRALRQFAVGPPTGPVRALDYFVYFVLALFQGHNDNFEDDDDAVGMETLLLNQTTGQAYTVAKKARADWF